MKKAVLKFFGIAFALLILGLWFFSWIDYADGERAGTVIKLNKRGYVFKTQEGEMNLGLVINGDAAASGIPQNWEFTVEDNPELVEKITKAMRSGQRVGLKYHQKYIVWPWVGNTKNIVYDAKEVDYPVKK